MKTQSRAKPNRSKGFTLVEILVTITIIVALAALVTGGTKKLREKADVVTTLKRISGFASANAMYASDHNGKYVPAIAFDEEGQGGVQWHYNPDYLAALIGDSKSFEDAEVFEGVDGLPEQVLDPVVVRAKKRYWSRISASFGYNTENMPGGGWGEPGTSRSHTTSTVKTPNETCAFITSTDWLTSYGGRYLWKNSPVEGKTENSKVAYRHQGKAVVVYYDGHSDTVSMKDMQRIDKFGGVNHVFWGGNRRSGGQ